MTVLGDDLSSHGPFGALALQAGDNCIVGCTPDSQPTFYERVAFWQAHDGMLQLESRHGKGRDPVVTISRDINEVPRRAGDPTVVVQWVDIPVVHGPTGAQLSHKSCITHHAVTAARVTAVAPAGRARWKSANDHNHVLQTTGDQVEHHCGPGKQSLAAFLLRLNLLALLFHTVLEWSADR